MFSDTKLELNILPNAHIGLLGNRNLTDKEMEDRCTEINVIYLIFIKFIITKHK
jgi:hypothetical protein